MFASKKQKVSIVVREVGCGSMARKCNDNLRQTLGLTKRMLQVANRAFSTQHDQESTRLLCLMREMAVKLRIRVEQEQESHQSKGTWD